MAKKTVLITGGTGGLGGAVSSAFLAAKYRVLVTYRKDPEFDDLLSNENFNPDLKGFKLDLTDESAISDLVKELTSNDGSVDALINLAGAWGGGKPLSASDTKTFDAMLNVNLRTAYLMTRAVLPSMIERDAGRIVCVSSRAALQSVTGSIEYNMAKTAILTLVQTVANEVKGSNITINAIAPSVIDTAQTRANMPDSDFSKWVKPTEIAKVLLFLCSDDAAVTSGGLIPVYGKA